MEYHENDLTQTVLIVDDEEDFLTDIAESLKGDEFSTFVFNNPTRAIAEAQKRPVDILLADIRLPGRINGWDVIKKIKLMSPDSDSIAITAFYEPEFKSLSQELGLFACVEKPISIDLLTRLIRSCCESRRLRREIKTLKDKSAGEMDSLREQYLLQSTLDALPFPVFVVDESGALLLSNHNGQEFLNTQCRRGRISNTYMLPPPILDALHADTDESLESNDMGLPQTVGFDSQTFRVRSWPMKNSLNKTRWVVFLEPPRITTETLLESESARVWLPILMRLAE